MRDITSSCFRAEGRAGNWVSTLVMSYDVSRGGRSSTRIPACCSRCKGAPVSGHGSLQHSTLWYLTATQTICSGASTFRKPTLWTNTVRSSSSLSFNGSPRHMHFLYQDAMALVGKKGEADFFITMTAHPKEKEV